jgi:hypothetical protein
MIHITPKRGPHPRLGPLGRNDALLNRPSGVVDASVGEFNNGIHLARNVPATHVVHQIDLLVGDGFLTMMDQQQCRGLTRADQPCYNISHHR